MTITSMDNRIPKKDGILCKKVRPVWLSGLSIIPQSEKLLARLLVMAHAWAEFGHHVWEAMIDVFLSHQCLSPSFSPSPPFSKNKYMKSFFWDKCTWTTIKKYSRGLKYIKSWTNWIFSIFMPLEGWVQWFYLTLKSVKHISNTKGVYFMLCSHHKKIVW